MNRNPLIESNRNKLTWTAVTTMVAAVIWSFLAIYGNTEILRALTESLIYTLMLAATGYLYWFLSHYIRPFQAQVVIAIVNQLLIVSITYAIATITGIEQQDRFSRNIPIFVIIGLFSWIVLSQWYRLKMLSHKKFPGNNGNNNNPETEEGEYEDKSPDRESVNEILDKISVKEGSHIHIIHLNELQYVQAYGDYVMLFTESGKHIKEQTMRYFETHLPQVFVRIHRSCIVNSEKIARAELFGKESYNIYLKNGTCLKASATGYKLLKERLLL
jgi:hypothetical protein